MARLTSLEICAGAGGQALGLERAKFDHVALVENDPDACTTLRRNRPHWNTLQWDLNEFSAERFKGVDLLSGGVPCPPFSVAGKQLGGEDERDLFPTAIDLADQCEPKAIMIENVKGILEPRFNDYRARIDERVKEMDYVGRWKLLNASDYGVPQLRPRALFIAIRKDYSDRFVWPAPSGEPPSVGEALFEEMASNGWEGAEEWATYADRIAPTLVGGSKKHGGPDLGPSRAKRAWAEQFGVNAHTIAEEPPARDHEGFPRLTVKMAAIIQGFRAGEWEFTGRKTSAYRQVGNAFPPPVAEAVGTAIINAIAPRSKRGRRRTATANGKAQKIKLSGVA
jgi:DNA (cytosine-5)-methyltransferase 1